MPKYGVVVFGATGFTGRLVCEHFLRNPGNPPLKWAIAGRTRSKLEDTRSKLVSVSADASTIPIIEADSSNLSSLVEMCKQTSVVLTTVGPYSLYGSLLVEACATTGTDYCDLTGETPWVREMIEKFDNTARRNRCRIVHCCGFDSVPSDIGALVASKTLRERHNVAADTIRGYVVSCRGGVSGGTIASGIAILSKGLRALRAMADPYVLCNSSVERASAKSGGPTAKVQSATALKGKDRKDTTCFVGWSAAVRRWTAPFVMAAINARVVRRSNELLGYRYGPMAQFSYEESMAMFRPGLAGMVSAAVAATAYYAFTALLVFPPTRWLMAKFLPQPGDGPSQEKMAKGHAKIAFVASGRTASTDKSRPAGDRRDVVAARVDFECRRDPGYADTSVMLGEIARLLSETGGDQTRPDSCLASGVLTPASAVGTAILPRLAQYNITWQPV
eukprot:TRINITY_DN109_c0_g2_i1.p1 TRINITY_DN109_c0_g2~~TRINITY_DN109_c0_g2_i1.p1  ORF type:complete len:447 (+),score=75.75 TRINITY_DN109_c0_g2_i1:92-1432(+)